MAKTEILTIEEILTPLISEIGYSYLNIDNTPGFANDMLNIAKKAAEAYADQFRTPGNVSPQAENILGIEFAEFVGSGFWFNNGDSDLWESFHEGEEFEVNGQMQFRFTTQELYQVFLTKNNEQ